MSGGSTIRTGQLRHTGTSIGPYQQGLGIRIGSISQVGSVSVGSDVSPVLSVLSGAGIGSTWSSMVSTGSVTSPVSPSSTSGSTAQAANRLVLTGAPVLSSAAMATGMLRKHNDAAARLSPTRVVNPRIAVCSRRCSVIGGWCHPDRDILAVPTGEMKVHRAWTADLTP